MKFHTNIRSTTTVSLTSDHRVIKKNTFSTKYFNLNIFIYLLLTNSLTNIGKLLGENVGLDFHGVSVASLQERPPPPLLLAHFDQTIEKMELINRWLRLNEEI